MKKTFASPKIVYGFIVRVVSVWLVAIIVYFWSADYKIAITAWLLFIASICLDFFREKNGFIRVWVDDAGIHNKYYSIKWHEIDKYDLGEVVIYYYNTKKVCPSVIYFGNYKKDKAFLKQNPKECVFVSIIPSHMQLLEKYGKGKSKAIDEILQRYYVTGNA